MKDESAEKQNYRNLTLREQEEEREHAKEENESGSKGDRRRRKRKNKRKNFPGSFPIVRQQSSCVRQTEIRPERRVVKADRKKRGKCLHN
jgi:hypothetical protein